MTQRSALAVSYSLMLLSSQVRAIDLTAVSVCQDATFHIPVSRGVACSGGGEQPLGVECPRVGDTAVDECYPYLSSFNGANCVAEEDAECIFLDGRHAWGCTFPSSTCSEILETQAVEDLPLSCATWKFASDDSFALTSDPFDIENLSDCEANWFTETVVAELLNCNVGTPTIAPTQEQETALPSIPSDASTIPIYRRIPDEETQTPSDPPTYAAVEMRVTLDVLTQGPEESIEATQTPYETPTQTDLATDGPEVPAVSAETISILFIEPETSSPSTYPEATQVTTLPETPLLMTTPPIKEQISTPSADTSPGISTPAPLVSEVESEVHIYQEQTTSPEISTPPPQVESEVPVYQEQTTSPVISTPPPLISEVDSEVPVYQELTQEQTTSPVTSTPPPKVETEAESEVPVYQEQSTSPVISTPLPLISEVESEVPVYQKQTTIPVTSTPPHQVETEAESEVPVYQKQTTIPVISTPKPQVESEAESEVPVYQEQTTSPVISTPPSLVSEVDSEVPVYHEQTSTPEVLTTESVTSEVESKYPAYEEKSTSVEVSTTAPIRKVVTEAPPYSLTSESTQTLAPDTSTPPTSSPPVSVTTKPPVSIIPASSFVSNSWFPMSTSESTPELTTESPTPTVTPCQSTSVPVFDSKTTITPTSTELATAETMLPTFSAETESTSPRSTYDQHTYDTPIVAETEAPLPTATVASSVETIDFTSAMPSYGSDSPDVLDEDTKHATATTPLPTTEVSTVPTESETPAATVARTPIPMETSIYSEAPCTETPVTQIPVIEFSTTQVTTTEAPVATISAFLEEDIQEEQLSYNPISVTTVFSSTKAVATQPPTEAAIQNPTEVTTSTTLSTVQSTVTPYVSSIGTSTQELKLQTSTQTNFTTIASVGISAAAVVAIAIALGSIVVVTIAVIRTRGRYNTPPVTATEDPQFENSIVLTPSDF